MWDEDAGALETLPHLRRNLRRAGLEETVAVIVARSAVAAEIWGPPVAMLFIDGGHTMEAALTDYRAWTPKLMAGGILAIHDVFPDPADGGRPPYEIYKLALASGLFAERLAVKSLRVLTRV